MSQAELRRIAEMQVRVGRLEAEVEYWRDRAVRAEQRGNVIPMPRVRPLEPISVGDGDARAISKLNIPVYDPNRNLILDPLDPLDPKKGA